MSTIHATLTSEGDWETKILRAVRGTLHRTLFEATDTCTTEPQETGRQMQGKFWGTLQKFFLRRSPFALKTVRRQMSVCPKTFAMAVRQNNHKKHMCSDWQQDQYVLSIVVIDDECQLSRWYL